MKTDIRDSTPLYRSLTDEGLQSLLDEQKTLVMQIMTEHEGQIIKGEGDAFWVVFESVRGAVETAVHLQTALRQQQARYREDQRVAIRIVIHVGDVLHRNHDIFGFPVDLTARMEGITPADEIYLSHAAWLCLNDAEITTEHVGDFDFKGVI